MTAESGAVIPVRMPQLNVNDEEVTVLNWLVANGGRAAEGKPLCEIETSKSVGELPSPASGVLRRVVEAGDVVRVDAVVGYVGPSMEVIESYLSMLSPREAARPAAASSAKVKASAGAVELARKSGIDLASVPAGGGRIRRSDVERYLAARPVRTGRPALAEERTPAGETFAVADDVVPAALAEAVEEVESLSNHDWGITRHLKETQGRLVVAHATMDVCMGRAVAWIEEQRRSGLMASPLPVLIKAAAAAVAACPKLQCFRMNRRVFRYSGVDIAFTARSHQGWLYTPVVRQADQRSLSEVAQQCGALGMGAFRGQVAEADLIGGCMTVSLLNDQPVRFHIGLQNSFQTALLTSGAIRQELRLVDGQVVAVPAITLALSYDHGLMDGWDAAVALDAARRTIEELQI